MCFDSTVESGYFEVIGLKKELRIIRIDSEKRVKKMRMTDQECRASVCKREGGEGGGVTMIDHLVSGPVPFPSCSLIADSCQ